MTLKTARKLKGLTQKELADRAGLDEATISRLETARQPYRTSYYETIVRIARAGLGIEPEELFPITFEAERETAAAATAAVR